MYLFLSKPKGPIGSDNLSQLSISLELLLKRIYPSSALDQELLLSKFQNIISSYESLFKSANKDDIGFPYWFCLCQSKLIYSCIVKLPSPSLILRILHAKISVSPSESGSPALASCAKLHNWPIPLFISSIWLDLSSNFPSVFDKRRRCG